VKSGKSYRTPKGEYFIPLGQHAETWRKSTIPILGLVYDPDDRLIRWIDLTGYLAAHPEQCTGNVPISQRHVLDAVTLHGAFKAALRAYEAGKAGRLTLNLLSPGALQIGAIYDAWALSRSTVIYLRVMRRFILEFEAEALRRAIFLLSHAGTHPNVLYTKDTWIPDRVSEQILPSFRWSPEEIAHMLRAVDYSDWGYHTLGECLDVLFYEDPNIVAKLHIAIGLLLHDPEKEQAVRAATLALTHSCDQKAELYKLTQEHPELTTHEWFRDISSAIGQSERYSLY
jgi:hypothetical protein